MADEGGRKQEEMKNDSESANKTKTDAEHKLENNASVERAQMNETAENIPGDRSTIKNGCPANDKDNQTISTGQCNSENSQMIMDEKGKQISKDKTNGKEMSKLESPNDSCQKDHSESSKANTNNDSSEFSDINDKEVVLKTKSNSELMKENKQLSESLDTKDSELTKYKGMLESANKVISDLEKSKRQLEETLDAYKLSIEELNKLKEQWNNDCRSLLEEGKAARGERERNEEIRRQFDDMKSDMMVKEQEYISTIHQKSQNENQFQAENEHLKNEVTKQNELLQRANQDVLNYQNQLKVAEESNITLHTRLEELESISKSKTEECLKLQQVSAQMKSTEIDLQEKNDKFVKERLLLSSQMLQDRDTIDKLKEAAKDNERLIQEQSETIATLHEQLKKEEETGAVLEKQNQELINEWTKKFLSKSTEYELECTKFKKSEEEKAQLKRSLTEQEKEIKNLQETQKTQENTIKELQDENTRKEDESRRKSDELQATKKLLWETTERLNVEKQQRECVRDLLRRKTSEMEFLEMSVVPMRSEIQVHLASNTAKDQSIQQLTHEKEDLRARLDSTEFRLSTVTSLEEKVQQLIEQNKRLDDELKKATAGYKQAVSMSGDRNTENQMLKQEIWRLRTESQSCKDRVKYLEASNRQLKEENESLLQDLNDNSSEQW